MTLQTDLREFIASFNANAVEYLIVGAHALTYHGVPRYTGDLDVFVRPSRENAKRIVSALGAFGFASLDLALDDFLLPDTIVQLGRPPGRIDVLSGITGVTFEEAWAGRAVGTLDGLPVAYIGKAELIRNKKAVGRLRDLDDVEKLEQ